MRGLGCSSVLFVWVWSNWHHRGVSESTLPLLDKSLNRLRRGHSQIGTYRYGMSTLFVVSQYLVVVQWFLYTLLFIWQAAVSFREWHWHQAWNSECRQHDQYVRIRQTIVVALLCKLHNGLCSFVLECFAMLSGVWTFLSSSHEVLNKWAKLCSAP